MNKILVLNLTRLGDLIQSTPMLSGLRKKYPDAHIILLAGKAFAGICEYIPFVDDIQVFDIKRFEPSLSGKEVSLVEIYRYMEGLLRGLQEQSFDLVVNLTHSKLSAMISHFSRAQKVIGMEATDFGDRQIKGLWINYFYNMVYNREFNRINLVDVYTKGSGCNPEGRKLYLKNTPQVEQTMKEVVVEYKLTDDDFVVGFQPGSSRVDRRWSSSSFAKVINKLKKEQNAKIVLFGTSAEEEAGWEIISLVDGEVINLIGKTDITHLIGTLRRTDILVTNDTGTMHIASALSVKVVALFFAHALCFETGPYGEGHLIVQADIACSPCSHHVQCNNMLCKEYIAPEDIYTLIALVRESPEDFKDRIKQDQEHFKQVTVYTAGFDQDNMIDCIPVTRRKLTDRDLIGMIYREVWKRLLDNSPSPGELVGRKEQETTKIRQVVAEKIEHYFFTASLPDLYQKIEESIASFATLAELSKKGQQVASSLLVEYQKEVKNISLIQEKGEQLGEIDQEIEKTGTAIVAVRPLVQQFLFGKDNLEGDDIESLAQDMNVLYLRLDAGSSLMNSVLTQLKTF